MLNIPTKPWPVLDMISADDHIIEPSHVWTSRAPARLKNKAPRVVVGKDGVETWLIEDRQKPNIGLSAMAGKRFEDYTAKAQNFKDMRRGCYDPAERVKDMDLDGVRTQIGFPTVPGISGENIMQIKDPELRDWAFQGYNDWLADEFQAHGDRLIGLGVLPLNEPEKAVIEAKRGASKGIKSLSIPGWPEGIPGCQPLAHPSYDPVWSTCEQLNLPINLHISSGKGQASFLKNPLPGQAEVFVTINSIDNMTILSWLIWGGVLEKHPSLKCVSSEGGIGWVPYFLERADHTYNRHRFWMKSNLQRPPSEYFHRQCFVAFINDYAGVFARHLIGVENILWESDYPHTDTTWPFSHKSADESLKGVPESERRLIVYENARRVYNLN